MEDAAPAWLPATSPGNVERLNRDMRAVARAITGCPRSTPHGSASDGRGRHRTRSDQAWIDRGPDSELSAVSRARRPGLVAELDPRPRPI